MKILYIATGEPDYLCDTLFHGLYSLFGENVVPSCDYDIMYSSYRKENDINKLYGKGFTVWGLLPEKFQNNHDIETKIKTKYFDYIIYGSITRTTKYFSLVCKYYNKSNIIFVDGEDTPQIFNDNLGVPLFKRELLLQKKNVFPISFSIPKEKICDNIESIIKTKVLADYTPNFAFSYSYDKEEDYYNGYKESYFGLTCKKAGWDCMRHYEILANYCIPYFVNIENCPIHTMKTFPKDILIISNKMYENKDYSNYFEILNKLFNYTKNNLTTEKVAENFINTIRGI